MSKRAAIQQRELEELEAEFKPLLISCVAECAKGRWGLFGQNDRLDPQRKYSQWQEADHLKELALQIRSIRSRLGSRNPLCERFLNYCSMRGPNAPGEPKLAQQLLNEIDSNEPNRA